MKQEIACPSPSGNVNLRVESLPFSDIPGQSLLFTEYQREPLSLKRFYPSGVENHTQISDCIPDVLANYKTDRVLLCNALEEINRKHGAGEETLQNIGLLREADAVAVVTGQQAGLFTGPLYTIYKALSAVKMAECLNARGSKAVPVFWIATEDHDFEEVSSAFFIGKEGELVKAKNTPRDYRKDIPVGFVKLGDSINKTIDDLFEFLTHTEFSDDLRDLLHQSWPAGVCYGDGFAKFLLEMLGNFGLIVIDPLDANIKELAAPIFVEAIGKTRVIVPALIKRSEELENAGYHAQVLVTDDYFPLFWHADSGARKGLKKIGDGIYHVKNEKLEFTLSQLAETAEKEPQRFSPGVMLRSVVQDYLLPTVCYFGGGAEIAYFAQNSEVYRILERPVTPILHRQSFTIVEAKHTRTLEKYGLEFRDLFAGLEKIIPGIVEKYIDPEAAKVFAEVEEKINTELNRLDQTVSQIDSTLAENLATRRRKILYHIGALRKKFYYAQLKKDETLNRQINAAFASLLPENQLQERTLNINTFLNRHGLYFIDWLYEAVDLSDKGHRIIYL